MNVKLNGGPTTHFILFLSPRFCIVLFSEVINQLAKQDTDVTTVFSHYFLVNKQFFSCFLIKTNPSYLLVSSFYFPMEVPLPVPPTHKGLHRLH